MSKVILSVLFVIVAAIVGGAVFLATWDIPAPTARHEVVISNDRFPK